MTRRALVVAHHRRPEAALATCEAQRALEAGGFEVVVSVEDAPPQPLLDVEVVVVVGGDGTILRAAELVRGRGVPILGINLGHVGFLAESEREDISEAVASLAAGEFTVEERRTLDVLIEHSDGTVSTDWALNEAALEKSDPARMVEVVVEIDGRPLSAFGCDGVVLSTASGSTAHAFSAGGPVVWPDVDAMILVPVAAHALFARPLVVGPASVLAVEILQRSPSPAIVSCDGRRSTSVGVGSRVVVRRSDEPVRLARLSHAPFSDRLVSKFALPVDGWRGERRVGG